MVLWPGEHKLKLSDLESKKGCGLLPIYGELTCKTKGLKWELTE